MRRGFAAAGARRDARVDEQPRAGAAGRCKAPARISQPGVWTWPRGQLISGAAAAAKAPILPVESLPPARATFRASGAFSIVKKCLTVDLFGEPEWLPLSGGLALSKAHASRGSFVGIAGPVHLSAETDLSRAEPRRRVSVARPLSDGKVLPERPTGPVAAAFNLSAVTRCNSAGRSTIWGSPYRSVLRGSRQASRALALSPMALPRPDFAGHFSRRAQRGLPGFFMMGAA